MISETLSMKRTYCALLFVTCLCLNSAPAFCQTLRPESEMRASPRDIREIFLTLPLPAKPEKNSLAEYYAGFIDTYEKRLKILEKPFTRYADYPNIFDLCPSGLAHFVDVRNVSSSLTLTARGSCRKRQLSNSDDYFVANCAPQANGY